MMDQPPKESRNISIWDKFESAAPGIPDWIRNKDQTGNILQALLKTLPAQSILITTTSEIFLLAGDVEAITQQKILQVLDAFWDPIQKSDLTRYLKDQNGEVTGFIFSATLFQNLILTLYYQDTPTLSIARAHTKRIIRALSGQTVASYAAKTIPVDAAIAAQMRKFFEQNAKQRLDHEAVAADELPLPSQADQGLESLLDLSSQTSQPNFSEEAETIDPSSLDDLLPSMDELLGSDLVSTSETIREIEQSTIEDSPAESRFSADETTSDTHIIEDTQQIELDNEITEHDLAQLAEELDDFLEDADNLDIDLVEQKEKLAAILQELPSPDPEPEPLERSHTDSQSTLTGSESTSQPEDFTLPWEGEGQPLPSEESRLETSQTSDITPENSPNFQDVLQQVQTTGLMIEQPLDDRAYTVIIIPRIAFHQLGQSFEHKFEQYLQQACQQGQCQVEGCSFFSDHIQLKLTLGGKSSIVKTIMHIKKQLETKILENYATFSDELEGNDLWLPGQLIFNDQEKLDSKRIQSFITNARL